MWIPRYLRRVRGGTEVGKSLAAALMLTWIYVYKQNPREREREWENKNEKTNQQHRMSEREREVLYTMFDNSVKSKSRHGFTQFKCLKRHIFASKWMSSTSSSSSCILQFCFICYKTIERAWISYLTKWKKEWNILNCKYAPAFC